MVAQQKHKIRITLKAYENNSLDISCNDIVKAIKRTQAKLIGPIPLPTQKRIYCVLRSPHVDKDSREHFELKIHKRIIDIHEPVSQTIDALMKLNLPAGVDVQVKI